MISDTPTSDPAPDSATTPVPAPFRVLIVEDNVDAAETLRDLVVLFGYDVAMSFTGDEGIEMARRLRPDVVLCDIGLPGIDGYGVARTLRAAPDTAAIRLVAVTGYGRDSDRQHSKEAGFEVHMIKPVDPAELRALLGRWAAERT
jgi:two-component system CheB/CheR fusion protein